MPDVVEWSDPPPRGSIGDYEWREIAAALDSRPGEWALIAAFDTASAASSLVGHVKRGRTVPALDPDHYEVKSRKLSDAEWGVWMRCIGTPEVDDDGEEA